MKYSILGFNQQKVIDYIYLTEDTELRCDITDLLLLNYLMYAQSNINMKHIMDKDNLPCVWLQHKHILEDLPILNITEGTLKNRLTKLRKMELITSVTIANEGTKGTCTYYRTTSFLNDMVFDTTSFLNDMKALPRHSKMMSNNSTNIDNKVNKNNSKELLENFELKGVKQTKPNLYSKCIAEINSRNYDDKLRTTLIEYLDLRLQMKDKPLYANSWKGLLNKLEREFSERDRLQVVYQSIERGYASFFPVNKGFNKSNSQLNKPWEKGVSCRKATKEEQEQTDKWLAEQRAKGIKVDF